MSARNIEQESFGTEFGQISEEEKSSSPPYPTPSSKQLNEFPSMLGETYKKFGLKRGILKQGEEVVFGDPVVLDRLRMEERAGHVAEGLRNQRRKINNQVLTSGKLR